MHFKTSLGTELVQGFRFTHYQKKACVYSIKLERVGQTGACTDFKVDATTINAPICDNINGVELSINIRFEPNNLGDSRAKLVVTNPEGMEYNCLLFGYSTAPQPQGPIKIVHTKTSPVDFKNPLSEKCEFNIRFDNPCFTLATKPPGPIEVSFYSFISFNLL